MKPNTQRWLGVTAAAAAALVCWCLLSMEPDSTTRTAGKALAGAAPVNSNSHAAQPRPKPGTPEFKRTMLERGQKWLDSRGRDAAGLVAMWDLTGDNALLREAAEKYPNDPRVCIAFVYGAGSQDVLYWVDRFVAADPENPDALILKAGTSGKSPDGADLSGAITLIRQAVNSKTPRNNHQRERMETVRAAALACGASPGDSARQALAVFSNYNLSDKGVLGALYVLTRAKEQAGIGGDRDRVVDLTRLGIALLEHPACDAPVSIRGAGYAPLEAIPFVDELPADTAVGSAGETIAQLRQKTVLSWEEAMRQLPAGVTEFPDSRGVVADASDAVISEFTDRVLRDGEMSATVWLVQQSGRAEADVVKEKPDAAR